MASLETWVLTVREERLVPVDLPEKRGVQETQENEERLEYKA